MGTDNLFSKRKAREASVLSRQQAVRKQNKRYLIVCEGEKTEPLYFGEMVSFLQIPEFQVRIAPNQGSSPDKIVSHALSLFEKDSKQGDPYDKVFCVFDRDEHSTYDMAMSRIDDLIKSKKPFSAITSTPCFEIWFLLHFTYTEMPFTKKGKKTACENLISKLKTYPLMKNYEKNTTGFFVLLQKKLQFAIKSAERLRQSSQNSGSQNPLTNVDLLIEDIQALKK